MAEGAVDYSTRNIRVGCAGWSIASANGGSFAAAGSHLERYSQVFSAVEINSSFYRPHRQSTYARWRDAVPDDFRFSVKIPKSITHECRLVDCESQLSVFLDSASALADKLGCLLVQLPPSFAYDETTATGFFDCLCNLTEVPVAFEPRHATWFSDTARAQLESVGVTVVLADPLPNGLARDFFSFSLYESFTYLRLHGSPEMYRSSYDPAQIQRLATRLIEKPTGTTWIVFDNTASGAAVPNALALVKCLKEAMAL
jgi:uncharacterized protein YecE (DUF72 family)